MIVICQNDFPIGVLPGATEEQAEAFIKKMRADSDAAITDPNQARPAFHWHDVPEMKEGWYGRSAPVGAAEDMVLDAIERRESSAPVGVEDGPIDASDNAEYIERCADMLERFGLRVTAGALRVIAHEHRSLAQQPAAVDEAMVDRAFAFCGHDPLTREDVRKMLTAALAQQPAPSAPVEVEASYHPCTSILIEGLKRLEGGSDVLAEWDRARAKADAALAQQPAATAAKDAEIEVLLAELDFRDSVIATHAADTREYQKRISQAEACAKRLVEVLRNSADALERLAFAIRAPNAHTPQLVELAIAMRTAALAQQPEARGARIARRRDVRLWMRHNAGFYDTATELAEAADDVFHLPDGALDNETHWVWDEAVDAINDAQREGRS